MVEVLEVKVGLRGLVELLEVKVGLLGLVELLEVKVGLQFQIVYHRNPYRHAPVIIP